MNKIPSGLTSTQLADKYKNQDGTTNGSNIKLIIDCLNNTNNDSDLNKCIVGKATVYHTNYGDYNQPPPRSCYDQGLKSPSQCDACGYNKPTCNTLSNLYTKMRNDNDLPKLPLNPCYTYGSYIYGSDLSNSSTGSEDACQTVCSQDPKCQYWTYDKKRNYCYMKSDNNDIRSDGGPDYITGPRSCTSCFRNNVDIPDRWLDYPKNSLGVTTGVLSATACQQACNANPDCKLFSYDNSTKKCYQRKYNSFLRTGAGLMRPAYTLPALSDTPNFTSGPNSCENKYPVCYGGLGDCDMEYKSFWTGKSTGYGKGKKINLV